MREASTQTRQLIADGGFDRVWVADLMYDGERRLKDVGISAPQLRWDGNAFVVGSGSARIVWNDDHGRSLIPRQIGDWFAPFGAELQIDCLVGAGVFSERVPMGRFVIEEVPEANEAELLFQGVLVHPGESFTVNLQDRLVKTAREEFPFPKPPGTPSAWQEAQSITGMPIVRNLPDADVPMSIAYEGKKEDALKKIFDLMQAWPSVDSGGTLTARPKAWPAPVDDIRGVVSAPFTLSSAKTYSMVVVEGKSASGEPIYAVAEVLEGFLRVRNSDGSESPFGSPVYRYASEFLDTYAKCEAYARSLLARVSKIRGVQRTIIEPFNPLREVGDVLRFRGGLVRIVELEHTAAETTSVVEVPDE